MYTNLYIYIHQIFISMHIHVYIYINIYVYTGTRTWTWCIQPQCKRASTSWSACSTKTPMMKSRRISDSGMMPLMVHVYCIHMYIAYTCIDDASDGIDILHTHVYMHTHTCVHIHIHIHVYIHINA